jgi:Flp pilus assembly protein TadD
MSREDGDFTAASEHLRRAVELEPDNYLAHREMGSYFFARGDFATASRFYQRAVERNAEDKLSMGYLACSLARSGRMDVAVRFFDRAGPGDWSNCDPRRAPAPPIR